MQLCNYAIMQLCNYAIMQLCNYAIMQLCNYEIKNDSVKSINQPKFMKGNVKNKKQQKTIIKNL